MTYDDFSEKLLFIKFEFRRMNGKELESIRELEDFLVRRQLSIQTMTHGRKGALKSLKGLSFG